MKFVQLILWKIIKIVATRYQILRLKCTKFDFGWGSAPDPAGGAYSTPPDPLAGFDGPTSKGGEGRGDTRRGWEGREGGEGRGWNREGRRRERRGGLSGNAAEEAFCLKSAPDYGGMVSQVKTSKLFQAPRKISSTFHFWHKSFILNDVKLAQLSNNSFKWKKRPERRKHCSRWM